MNEQEREMELLEKVRQQRRKKKLTIVLVVIIALAAAVGLFVSHSGSSLLGGQTVTLEIVCTDLTEDMSVLKDESLKKYIPEDGVILPETTYAFKKGATVYDALADICRENKIHMESKYDAFYQSYYIKGLGHLYEFDAGKRSGWMYKVNGTAPDYGANQVELTKGDKILWYYVVDYTKE